MAEEVRTIVAVIRPEVAASGASPGIVELTSKLKLLHRTADGTVSAVEKVGEVRIAGEKQATSAKKLIERFVDGAKQARQYESAINQLQRTMEAMTLDQQIATIEGINRAYGKLPQALKLVKGDLAGLEKGARESGEAFQASALIVARAQKAIRDEIAETAAAASAANLVLAANRVNTFLNRDRGGQVARPPIVGGANRVFGEELGDALEPQLRAREESARRLAETYDRAGAATRRLSEDAAKLSQAYKIGDLDALQYARAMGGLRLAMDEATGATTRADTAQRQAQGAIRATAAAWQEYKSRMEQASAANSQEAYRKFFGIRDFEQISQLQRREYEQHWQQMLAIRDRAVSRPLRETVDRLTGVERRGTTLDPARRRADAEAAFNPASDSKFQADKASIQDLAASYDRLGSAIKRVEADERRFAAALADGSMTAAQYRTAMQATAAAKVDLARGSQGLAVSMSQLGVAHQNLYTRNLILQSALVNTFQSVAAGQGVFSTLFVQATQAVGAFGNLRIGLLAVAAGAAVVIGSTVGIARSIVTVGDAANLARGRMEQFLGTTQEASRVYANLQMLGAQTGVRANESAGVFSRLLIGGEQLGATTVQMERMLETFQKLGVLGSATNQELVAGMRQFTQALGKGKLDGDELRSVLENIPEVIRLIGRNLGKTTEELRTMGANGELTSRLVFGAMLRGSDEVDARFGRLPLTMNRAMGQVGVAVEGVLEFMNRWLGLSDRIAEMLAGVARRLTEFRQWLQSLENPNNTENNLARTNTARTAAQERVTALQARIAQLVRDQEKLEEDRSRVDPNAPGRGDLAFARRIAELLQARVRLQEQLEQAQEVLGQRQTEAIQATQADAPRQDAAVAMAADLQSQSALAMAERERLERLRLIREENDKILKSAEGAPEINRQALARSNSLREELEMVMANIGRARHELDQLGVMGDQGSHLRQLDLQKEIEASLQRQILLESGLERVEIERLQQIEQLGAQTRRDEARAAREVQQLEAAIARTAGRAETGGVSEETRAWLSLTAAVEAYVGKVPEAERNQGLLRRAAEAQGAALENLTERYRLHMLEVGKQAEEVGFNAQIRALEAQNTTEARIEIERLKAARQQETVEVQRQIQLSRLNADIAATEEGPAKERLRQQVELLNAAYDRLAGSINAAVTAEAAFNRANREGAQNAAAIVRRINTPETIDETARLDTRTVEAERERIRVQTRSAQQQLATFEVQGLGTAEERNRLRQQANDLLRQETVLTSTIAGIEQNRLKERERLNADQTRAAARATREVERLERAIGRGSERADRSGASSEMRAYREINVAIAAYNAKVPLASRDTGLLADAQRAQAEVMEDLTRRWTLHIDQINQSSRDIEVQNQIKRLEMDGSREARAEIDRLTTARQLERLEIQRANDLRQLNIDLTIADAEAKRVLEERIRAVNAAYDRQAAAVQAPENQRSVGDLADAQKRALDNATKESADFLYDAFSGKINSIGDLLANTLKRGLADALAEEFIRPLLRPIISTIVGGFSTSVGGGGLSNLLNRGSNAIGFGDITGANGIGARINAAAVSAFPSVFGTPPAAAKSGGAWTGTQEPFNKPGVTGTASASAGSAVGTASLLDSLGGIAGGFGIGSAIGSLTAQGNPAKQQNGMIGAGGGAVAGAIIGSMIPGVGTVLGALIGGALGGGAGGLIGPQPSNMEGFAEFNFANGRRTIGGQTGSKFSAANRSAASTMAGQIEDAVNGIAEALGATKPSQGWFRVGTGNRDGIFYDYDASGQGNWSQATRKRYEKGDEQRMLADLLAEFIPGIAGGLSDLLRQAIAHTRADSGEAIIEIADWIGGVYKPLTELEEPMTEYARRLKELNKTYADAIVQANQYGISEAALVANRERAIEQLRQERLDSVAPNATNIFTSLADYTRDLRTREDNTGNPMSRYSAAQEQFFFDLTSATAATGDYKSLQRFQSSADQYLSQARDIYGTGSGFLTVFNQVSEALAQLGGMDSTSILEAAIRDSEQTQTATLQAELQRLTSEVIALRREVQQNGLNPLGGQ